MSAKRQRLRNRPSGPPAHEARGRPGGIGRPSSAAAESVSDALRRESDTYLDRRRRIAALTLGAMGSLGAVAAYPFGLVGGLPEPPLRILNANRVDASGEAYHYLQTPDAALGLLSSAATLVLVGMGNRRRASSRHWLLLAMAAKVAGDAAFGLYLTAEQVSKHRRLCSYSLVAAAASVVAVPQAVPEALASVAARRRRA